MIEGYKTKEMKPAKTKKVKEVIFQGDDGLFYFEWEGKKQGFTKKENAEIALARLKNEQ
jgi:tRNA A37 threonylcarbamoyladenosine biosynthesis protein TsaE